MVINLVDSGSQFNMSLLPDGTHGDSVPRVGEYLSFVTPEGIVYKGIVTKVVWGIGNDKELFATIYLHREEG